MIASSADDVETFFESMLRTGISEEMKQETELAFPICFLAHGQHENFPILFFFEDLQSRGTIARGIIAPACLSLDVSAEYRQPE